MISLIIRQMSELDFSRVYSIILNSLDEYYVPEVLSYFTKQWPKGQLVACTYSGKIIGFLCGSDLGPDRVGVALFAVENGSRGQGIGTKLLSALRHYAYVKGAHTIQLEVRVENADAIKFYASRGFIVTETLSSFYNNGGDAIRMIGLTTENS